MPRGPPRSLLNLIDLSVSGMNKMSRLASSTVASSNVRRHSTMSVRRREALGHRDICCDLRRGLEWKFLRSTTSASASDEPGGAAKGASASSAGGIRRAGLSGITGAPRD